MDEQDLMPQIGIWGPTAAGKTTYLSGLKLAIDVFQQNLKFWAINEPAQQFIEVNAAKIAEGRFPRSTDYAQPENYIFRIYREDGGLLGNPNESHEINLIDAAGALILDAGDPKGYFAKLRQCAGLLIMIDPEQKRRLQEGEEGETYFSTLHRLLHRLGETRRTESGRLDIHLAFCITKSDLNPHWDHRKEPAKYLEQLLGRPAYNGIINYCTSSKVFAVSVAGRYKTKEGTVLPNLTFDKNGIPQIADLSQWKPYNVIQPLLWLFDQIDADLESNQSSLSKMKRRFTRKPYYYEDPE